ncbi:MAG: AAA family ATPase [Leptospirillum sp.]
MPFIKIKSIKFGEIPFRRLKNLDITIAKRLTIIAGHNGVGKSTILGFLANGSGLSTTDFTSYFNRVYQGNFHEIVSLSSEFDLIKDQDKKPFAEIRYDISGKEVVKKCNVTGNPDRLRVVPRNEPKKEISIQGILVKRDGKVPVPTIYLGISRLIPLGETIPKHINTTSDFRINDEDAKYIRNLTKKIIDAGVKDENRITDQSIKGTRKTSKHPQYSYSSKAISLGQDSLSAIITALASFRKIKREMGEEYLGGILIIDEIDVGFHPRTQLELIRILQSESKNLELQVITTTHSLTLIKNIIESIKKIPTTGERLDEVVYLQDTLHPFQQKEVTWNKVQSDMFLIPEHPTEVKIYTEDDEAEYFLKKILIGKNRKIKKETGFMLKIISAKMGCDVLKSLYKADDYFKSVVIVLDADSTFESGNNSINNILSLPSDPSSAKQTVENILHDFLKSIREDAPRYPKIWKTLNNLNVTTDYIGANLIDDSVDFTKRDAAKKWFNEKKDEINRLSIVKLWAAENQKKTDEFVDKLIIAIKSVSQN